MEKRRRATDAEEEEEEEEERQEQRALFQCADLILPWLHPTELAAISSTCKTLNQISKPITSRRSSDASRGSEKLPIPFINAVDHHPYAHFIYTPTQFPRVDPDPIGDGSGCECKETRRCDADSGCPCSSSLNSAELTLECGPSCRCCGRECGNRLSQGGVSVGLRIVRDGRKGWGLHAAQLIKRGQFICEYAGEVLTTKEARRRQEKYDEVASSGRFSSCALLVVREHLPSGKACMRMNIDATVIGNVARFINHSCDGGNLSTTLVRSSGALLPRLCFFASRDIQEDEELTFSYGEIRLGSSKRIMRCFCATSSCFGILPSENT